MEQIVRSLDEEKLITCINKLRDILNEMCYTNDEPGASMERLIVSCELDELIVEYMNLKNRYHEGE